MSGLLKLFNRRHLLGLGLALLLVSPALAAADPKDFIQNLSKTVIDALSRGANQAERQRLFNDLLGKAVDTESVGKFALGRYYKQATPEQIQKFNGLFKQFVALTYAKQLSDYAGQQLVIKGESQPDADQATMVASEIERKDGQPIKLDWKVKQVGGDLRIVDVRIEGISMAQSQRDDFASVIQSGGGKIDALLTQLENRNNQLMSGK